MRRFALLILTALLLSGCARSAMRPRQGEYWTGGQRFEPAWERFYRPETPHEPELDDPLIDAGAEMVPAIGEAVARKDMQYRRYAIGALGYIGDSRALPVLLSVLGDKSEEFYFRDDALTSIYLIDEVKAAGLAQSLQTDPELGETARAILNKESWLKEPSEE